MALAPIPAVPDSERRTRKVLTAASSATIELTFAIWASGSDYANWLEVWQDGIKLPNTAWSLSHPSGPLANLPRPITAAIVTPHVPFDGTIDIIGAERPRRPILFTEGVGVPARDHNRAYNDHTAIAREGWDQRLRTLRGAPSEIINAIPPVAIRKTKVLGFDSAGQPVVSEKTMSDIDEAVDLIAYLEALIAGMANGNPNIVVLSSVATLRAVSAATVTATMALVQAWHAGGQKGGGIFRLDMTDTTSLDDKGLVIVDASARRWKRIVGAFVTPAMFGWPFVGASAAAINLQNEAMATACFTQNVPLSLVEDSNEFGPIPGNFPIQLKIDPLAGLTGPMQDIQAWARIEAACDWVASCRKVAKGDIEVHIFTAAAGAIPVYGQYIHVHTNVGGNDIGTLSVSMPGVRITDPAASIPSVVVTSGSGSVTFQPRRSEVVQIRLNGNPGNGGAGYSSPPTVAITAAATDPGTGATAVAYLDPRPGHEGEVGGIRITNGGANWLADPHKPIVVTLSGGGFTTAATASAYANKNIQECRMIVSWLPPDIVAGMPFGVYGYGGTNDCGAINGAHVVKGWSRASADPVNYPNGGTLIFDLTAPRAEPLFGGQPHITSVGQIDAGVFWPTTWLKSTGGWYGAGGGEGLFTAGGNGTVSLNQVAATWAPNQNVPEDGAAMNSGVQTPQRSSTAQVFTNTSRDGAMLYLEDRVIAVGFPGSGIRVARGAMFANRAYLGAGIAHVAENHIVCQVQNGGYYGISKCAFGSSNALVLAVQGGCQGYITHSFVGCGGTGITCYGWMDCQITKVHSCTTGIKLIAGGEAYGSYAEPADYADVGAPGRQAWLDSLSTTDVVRCTVGLSLKEIGRMITRIRITGSINDYSDVPLNTSSWGGGWFGDIPIPASPGHFYQPHQTVNVLQIRRQYDVGTAVGTADIVTINEPAGVATTKALTTAVDGTYIFTIVSSYITATSIVRCSVQNGSNAAGIPIISTITPDAGGSVAVKIFNAGGGAFNGTLKVSFLIDDTIIENFAAIDPIGGEIGTPVLLDGGP